MANFITLSSSRAGSRGGLRPALTKFYHAIQVADLVANVVSDLSQTDSSYLDTST